MRTLVKTVENFDIYFEPLEEHIPLTDLFMAEYVQEVIDKVNSGEWVYFCAKVTAEKNGIELADTYLGGCVYVDFEEFYTKYESEYFSDMVNEVITEAKVAIKELCK